MLTAPLVYRMEPASRYTVFVDGYNVIKRHPSWRELPLAEARRRLISLLSTFAWPVPTANIYVVFDTRDPSGTTTQAIRQLRVVYAHPSADAYIQEAIRRHPSPARAMVVSDDSEILRTAKSHGVTRQSVQWLTPPPRSSRHARPGMEKSHLPASEIRRIQEELSRRWLAS